MHQLLAVLPQWCTGTSLLDSWTPTEVLLSVGGCQNQCSWEDDSRNSYSATLLMSLPFNFSEWWGCRAAGEQVHLPAKISMFWINLPSLSDNQTIKYFSVLIQTFVTNDVYPPWDYLYFNRTQHLALQKCIVNPEGRRWEDELVRKRMRTIRSFWSHTLLLVMG